MKLKLALLSSLVALGGSVQAADISTPDILSSVSPESVQAMSKAESADVRGEYKYCSGLNTCTQTFYSYGRPSNPPQGSRIRITGRIGNWYASR